MSGFVIGVEARAYNATIRRRRRELGLTQRQLADLAGVTLRVVGHLETLRNPKVTPQARKVLAVLGLDEDASPQWIAALELYGTRRVERPLTEELARAAERREIPQVVHDLTDPSLADPADVAVTADRRAALERSLCLLPDRDRKIVEMRWGLGGGLPSSRDELAEHFGVTRERIRQLETRAFKQLRLSMEPVA